MKIPKISLEKIVKLQRRKIFVEPEKEYNEIGIYSYGRGIFHKSPKSGLELENKKIYETKEGDLVLLNVFAWEGAIAIASSKDDGRCGSHRYLTYECDKEQCIVDYLKYYLLTPEGLQQIKKISPGSAGRNRTLNTKRINEIFVPLPSKLIQKKIIKTLDDILDESKRLSENFQNLPSLTESLRLSLLDYGCSGKLTKKWRKKYTKIETAGKFLKKLKKIRKENYEQNYALWKKNKCKKPTKNFDIIFNQHPTIDSWAKVNLEHLVYMAGRIGWKGLTADEYVDEGPLLLSVENLNHGEYVTFDNANHITQERYDESLEIQLQNNDVLFVKAGAGIGKTGIIKNIKKPSTMNGSIVVVRSPEVFYPKFLFYLLSSPNIQNLSKNKTRKGSTPGLYERDIKNFFIDLPPMDEQIEIANHLELLMNKVYENQKCCNNISKMLKSLPKSSLIHYFSN